MSNWTTIAIIATVFSATYGLCLLSAREGRLWCRLGRHTWQNSRAFPRTQYCRYCPAKHTYR